MNPSNPTYPTEARILEDAMKAFPRHPLFTDVNKKYREAYVRGQVELIHALKNPHKSTYQERKKILPPENQFLLQASNQSQADLHREYIDQIIQDRSITINQKIEQLEAELEIILDTDLFAETIKRIEKLEDTLFFKSSLKRTKNKLVPANY